MLFKVSKTTFAKIIRNTASLHDRKQYKQNRNLVYCRHLAENLLINPSHTYTYSYGKVACMFL